MDTIDDSLRDSVFNEKKSIFEKKAQNVSIILLVYNKVLFSQKGVPIP